MDPLVLIVLVIAFALLFDVSNGWDDSANDIAMVMSMRVLRPGPAVLAVDMAHYVINLATRVSRCWPRSLSSQ